jgi:hypothetical protein
MSAIVVFLFMMGGAWLWSRKAEKAEADRAALKAETDKHASDAPLMAWYGETR